MTNVLKTTNILNGKMYANLCVAKLKEQVQNLGITPRLDVIVAEEDPSSMIYVKMKRKIAESIGIKGKEYYVNNNSTQKEVMELITKLNHNPEIHGVLIQHPLPKHLNEKELFFHLSEKKDVDGITPISIGRLISKMDTHKSATPYGIIKLLKFYDINIKGTKTLVVGESQILGRPMAIMMLNELATVTIAHQFTQNLNELVAQAEIVISATGVPGLIKTEFLNENAIVVDCGIKKIDGEIFGDVQKSAMEKVAWMTPVPGGVGPMTIATLMENTVNAAMEKYCKA